MTRAAMEARLRELGVEVDADLSDTDVHRLLIRTLSDQLNDSLSVAEDQEPEKGTEVEVLDRLPERVARPLIPNAAVWAHLANMAVPLARSNLVKPALRGKE